MFIKNLIVLMIALPLVAFAKPIATAELKIYEQPISMQIDYFANLYGIESSIVKAVVRCESGGNPNAIGDGGRSRGIAQFQKSTWDSLLKIYQKEYNEELDYNSSYDQLRLLTYSIAEGHGSHWVAYRAIKNGGQYSFYSSQMNRSYTVYCKL